MALVTSLSIDKLGITYAINKYDNDKKHRVSISPKLQISLNKYIFKILNKNNLNYSAKNSFTLEAFNDKTIKLLDSESKEVYAIDKDKNTIDKILAKIHSNLILQKTLKNTSKTQADIKTDNLFDKIRNIINYIFVEKLYHAKLTDVAFLALMVFTIISIALNHHHGSVFLSNFEHFVKGARYYSHPIFGGLNITVGLAILTQSIKNFRDAKKIKNNKDMLIAAFSMLFSLAIITTGSVAITSLSNDYLLKTLFTICAGFSLCLGSNNLIKTLILRKRLQKNKADLQKFFEDLILINKKEIDSYKQKIEALDEKTITKNLKNNATKVKFEKFQNQNLEKRRQKLLNIELVMLQKRKIEKIEKLVRLEKTQRIIKASLGYIDITLEKDLKKELRNRSIAECFRIFAPLLAIGAFSINGAAHFDNSQNKNLVYYSIMLFSKLSGFWLNYSKRLRNVPAKENKTSFNFENIKNDVNLQPPRAV